MARNPEFWECFEELMTLAGEVPTEVLAKKATAMFPGLADDPEQRAHFRERLRVSVECLRQVPRTEREAAEVIAFLQATGFEIVSAEMDGEPLGPVDFSPWLPAVSWVIVGGESGSQARPFDLAWARQTIAQCRAAGAAPFVKQMGIRTMEDGQRFPVKDIHDLSLWPADLRVREYPRSTVKAMAEAER